MTSGQSHKALHEGTNMSEMILLLSFGYGGAESRVLKVVRRLAVARSLHICVNKEFIDAAGGRQDVHAALSELEAAGRIIYLPRVPRRLGLLRYLWVLVCSTYCVVKHRPNVFHGVLGGVLLIPVAKLMRAKTLAELTSPDNVRFVKKFSRVIEPFCDRYIAVSETVEAAAKDQMPNIVDRIEAYPVPYYEFRDYVGQKSLGKLTVAFCSRLIPRKNAYLFALSMLLLLKRRADFVVNIMGSGPDEQRIRGLLQEYADSGRVTCGRVPNPFDELQKSHIFVSLIEPDNYPSQSVLEAMNAGNALVLSDTGLSGRFISDKNGILVPLVPEKIADAVDQLMENKVDLPEMGLASVRLLCNAFGSEKYISYLCRVYDDLLLMPSAADVDKA